MPARRGAAAPRKGPKQPENLSAALHGQRGRDALCRKETRAAGDPFPPRGPAVYLKRPPTVLLASSVTEQGPVPEQAPVQLVSLYPGSGIAVSGTTVP